MSIIQWLVTPLHVDVDEDVCLSCDEVATRPMGVMGLLFVDLRYRRRVADAEARGWTMYPVDQEAARRGRSQVIAPSRKERRAPPGTASGPRCRQDPE